MVFIKIIILKNQTIKNYNIVTIKKYLSVILFIFVGFNTMAQNTNSLELANEISHDREAIRRDALFVSTTVAGNPYLNRNFQNGMLIEKNGLKSSIIPLRYNIYSGYIEYKAPDNKVYTLKREDGKIKSYVIHDTTFIYSPFHRTKNKIVSGYFQVLVPGTATGLIKYTVELLEAQPTRPYKPAQPEHFSRIIYSFYVKTENNAAVPVPRNKDFLQLFPKQKRKLSQYIKKEKIHIRKQVDFVNLVNYYNLLAGSGN